MEQSTSPSFFDRPAVKVENLPIGSGVPIGVERVTNPVVGLGGAYGAWGECFDNKSLPELIQSRLGTPLALEEIMNLDELGFTCRHHVPDLSEDDHIELEEQVGARFLSEAANASGWDTSEVDAVLIGLSGPSSGDYCERIARRAGVPENSLVVSIHKACDGSVAGLHMALNPSLPINEHLSRNLAQSLQGKKVLVGGIEGLSRFMRHAHDKNALQLFGNGAGVIGLVPGENMKFIVGKTHEVYDEEGVLAVHMYYPHSKQRQEGRSMIEVTQAGEHRIRVAGLMHEPDNDEPVQMAGLMGMVKLFVRSGVQTVEEVYRAYQGKLAELGVDKSIAIAVVHHANYKINKLIEKTLQKSDIRLNMPWVLSDFGNVSAASNMIAFLRVLKNLHPGDHILFNGFGAGTYYDALAVELGG
jgi:3-oxoacyl-[acyl-carrier-protein] synthase III